MKGSLRERTVQQAAAEWLKNNLSSRANLNAAHYWLEVTVSKDSLRGWGRADALVAAVDDSGKIYTASLEAKSLRTLCALRGYSITAFQLIIAALLATICWLLLDMLLDGQYRAITIASAFIVLLPAWFLILFLKSLFIKPAYVVRQVLDYPADERWIAVSRDALDALGNQLQDLQDICLGKGIGLLEVSRQKNVYVILEAKPRKRPGRFLQQYSNADTMCEELLRSIPNGLGNSD